MESFGRAKDTQLRVEIGNLSNMLAQHQRHEPRRTEEEVEEARKLAETKAAEADTEAGAEDAALEEAVPDPFEVAHDLWRAELERLEALGALRAKQQGQLLSGLSGFRELNTPEAVVELRDTDGDTVPFPLKSEPLCPASDVLEAKRRFSLWRTGLPVPAEKEGAEPTLATVPLSFDLDPEPDANFGKAEAATADS